MEKAIKRAIKMRFQTKIAHGDHTESYEFTTRGELYHKGNNDYLRFEESLSETDTVQTTMKWNGRELMLIRQGVILMRQAFVSGEKTVGRYVTPEASWETTATTDKVFVQWPSGKQKGSIQLSYQFALQGQDTGVHQVRLTLEEDTTK
ncbi:DUF1934 domain-containing protein [Halalkalibacter nanhaiisediminis]|uniref:Uncharacterized beta-barrel protein YwiB (DUF1934 family) n=1 Tax=Halalkalibacter nanhaiisediminis TaxID=688079 RepID=A0A562QSM8_9BACI|nr:DUF1934 family protein [Halalkalibacter nanhaiisediminis]TWI59744.1 uncharacterized beta-barrel protein YwiB (DUF1934 family) [Halalkalibacter nanhaiisediminis]